MAFWVGPVLEVRTKIGKVADTFSRGRGWVPGLVAIETVGLSSVVLNDWSLSICIICLSSLNFSEHWFPHFKWAIKTLNFRIK